MAGPDRPGSVIARYRRAGFIPPLRGPGLPGPMFIFPPMPRNSRPVYSTSAGRLCPDCGLPLDSCRCRAEAAEQPLGDGNVRVGRETAGRKGAGVTVITGLPLAAAALETLGRELKKLCGSGGTVQGGRIEIQGDHRDRLVAELARRGYRAKRSGG